MSSSSSDSTTPTHGRSLVFVGLERSPPYIVERIKLPTELQPEEVLIKIEIATICSSDLHTLYGRRTTPRPCVLGHEGCGEVVKSNRPDVKEGEKVTWGICASCNNCLPCSLNLTNKCENLVKCGHVVLNKAPLFGTYSTHILCPPGSPIVTLPPVITPTLGATINCALATMVNAVAKIPPVPRPGQPGASVALIQGAGTVGMYVAALLKELGFTKIMCVDQNRSRLARVAEFGGTPIHPDLEEELIQSDSVDVVFEVCGNVKVVPNGIRVLRAGGTYIFVGAVHGDSNLDVLAQTIIMKCLTLIGVHNYTGQHLEEAVKFLSQHHDRYPFSTLIGRTYPLSQFKNAVDAAGSGHFFRVAINPHL